MQELNEIPFEWEILPNIFQIILLVFLYHWTDAYLPFQVWKHWFYSDFMEYEMTENKMELSIKKIAKCIYAASSLS